MKKIVRKNTIDLEGVKRKINNALSEKGQALAEALRALIDELEASDVEVDEEALKAEVKKVIDEMEEVPEAVANAIAEKFATVKNSIADKQELTPKVKNEIAAAIMRAGKKESVKDAVEGILVKNDITGLTFADVVDYTIVEAWGDYNPLFKQLYKTPFTKFFYNDDDLSTADILAKQWDKSSEVEKAIQQIAVEGKSISTKYIYKRQRAALEDLDEIEKAGETANFLRWINEELDRQIVNTIVKAMLVGDTTNPVGSRVSTFETIGTKSASDAFTTLVNPESANNVTVADVRRMCDSVKNPHGKRKVLVIAPEVLFEISQFIFAAGGTTDFRSVEELASKLGVDEIIKSDLLQASDGLYAICMLPQGYWYNEKAALQVAYPHYENNVMNYQKERNIGGAIHDLYSTAVLKEAE